MEYKTIIEGLNSLDTTARKAYDQLQVMNTLYNNNGRINRNAIDSQLEKTLYAMSQESMPKVTTTISGWLFKSESYQLTQYGERYIKTEKDNVNRIKSEIGKIQPYENIDEKVEKILKSHGMNHVDYFAKKTIILDKIPDEANKFSNIRDIGDYISKKLSSKESKNKKRAEKMTQYDSAVATSGNSSDDILMYAMFAGVMLNDTPAPVSTRHSSSDGYGSSSDSSSSFFGSSGCGGGSVSSCGGGCGGGGCGGGGCGGG
jgi:hypothetical protein